MSDVSEPQKHVDDDICKILSCLVNIIRWNIIEKILQDEIILPLGSQDAFELSGEIFEFY